MKNILIIGTGGTIASAKSNGGLIPQLQADELLRFVPDTGNIANITAVQLFSVDSTNMHADHWLALSRCIEENYESYDGFVITHGTDTMAYTSAALSYLIQDSPKPIVLTGAQKPIDEDNTDARINLADSVIFACDGRAHGVNIVFDRKVICGTRARKERTKSYNAFSSINFPYIAVIQDQHVIFYINDKAVVSAPGKPDGPVFYRSLNPSVGLLKLIPSMKARTLIDMAESYDAVIIESFGVGGLPAYGSDDFKSAAARLVNTGKIIVMATQVPLEGSSMSVYAVGKSVKEEFDLLETYDMTLESTVAKLMWILGQTGDPAEVRKLFYSTINHDTLFPAKG